MGAKKFKKDMDLTAGFFGNFSPVESDQGGEDPSAAINISMAEASDKKGHGGRPQKEGLKKEQFTLTLHPETYEKLKILAADYTGGNFSRLVTDAIKAYCDKVEVNFEDIKVDREILQKYIDRQEKRFKKK